MKELTECLQCLCFGIILALILGELMLSSDYSEPIFKQEEPIPQINFKDFLGFLKFPNC